MVNELVKLIDYSQRGEYTLVYSAQDRAGNKADAMIFHMFVRDTKPPVLTHAAVIDKTYSSHFKIPAISANDAYDGNVDDTLAIKVMAPSGVSSAYQKSVGIDISTQGVYQIVATARDFASVFGKKAHSNMAELKGTVKVAAGTVTLSWGKQESIVFHASPTPSPTSAPPGPTPSPRPSGVSAPPVLVLFDTDETTGQNKLISRGSAYGVHGTKEAYVQHLAAEGHSSDDISDAIQQIVASEIMLAKTLGEWTKWTGNV